MYDRLSMFNSAEYNGTMAPQSGRNNGHPMVISGQHRNLPAQVPNTRLTNCPPPSYPGRRASTDARNYGPPAPEAVRLRFDPARHGPYPPERRPPAAPPRHPTPHNPPLRLIIPEWIDNIDVAIEVYVSLNLIPSYNDFKKTDDTLRTRVPKPFLSNKRNSNAVESSAETVPEKRILIKPKPLKDILEPGNIALLEIQSRHPALTVKSSPFSTNSPSETRAPVASSVQISKRSTLSTCSGSPPAAAPEPSSTGPATSSNSSSKAQVPETVPVQSSECPATSTHSPGNAQVAFPSLTQSAVSPISTKVISDAQVTLPVLSSVRPSITIKVTNNAQIPVTSPVQTSKVDATSAILPNNDEVSITQVQSSVLPSIPTKVTSSAVLSVPSLNLPLISTILTSNAEVSVPVRAQSSPAIPTKVTSSAQVTDTLPVQSSKSATPPSNTEVSVTPPIITTDPTSNVQILVTTPVQSSVCTATNSPPNSSLQAVKDQNLMASKNISNECSIINSTKNLNHPKSDLRNDRTVNADVTEPPDSVTIYSSSGEFNILSQNQILNIDEDLSIIDVINDMQKRSSDILPSLDSKKVKPCNCKVDQATIDSCARKKIKYSKSAEKRNKKSKFIEKWGHLFNDSSHKISNSNCKNNCNEEKGKQLFKEHKKTNGDFNCEYQKCKSNKKYKKKDDSSLKVKRKQGRKKEKDKSVTSCIKEDLSEETKSNDSSQSNNTTVNDKSSKSVKLSNPDSYLIIHSSALNIPKTSLDFVSKTSTENDDLQFSESRQNCVIKFKQSLPSTSYQVSSKAENPYDFDKRMKQVDGEHERRTASPHEGCQDTQDGTRPKDPVKSPGPEIKKDKASVPLKKCDLEEKPVACPKVESKIDIVNVPEKLFSPKAEYKSELDNPMHTCKIDSLRPTTEEKHLIGHEKKEHIIPPAQKIKGVHRKSQLQEFDMFKYVENLDDKKLVKPKVKNLKKDKSNRRENYIKKHRIKDSFVKLQRIPELDSAARKKKVFCNVTSNNCNPLRTFNFENSPEKKLDLGVNVEQKNHSLQINCIESLSDNKISNCSRNINFSESHSNNMANNGRKKTMPLDEDEELKAKIKIGQIASYMSLSYPLKVTILNKSMATENNNASLENSSGKLKCLSLSRHKHSNSRKNSEERWRKMDNEKRNKLEGSGKSTHGGIKVDVEVPQKSAGKQADVEHEGRTGLPHEGAKDETRRKDPAKSSEDAGRKQISPFENAEKCCNSNSAKGSSSHGTDEDGNSSEGVLTSDMWFNSTGALEKAIYLSRQVPTGLLRGKRKWSQEPGAGQRKKLAERKERKRPLVEAKKNWPDPVEKDDRSPEVCKLGLEVRGNKLARLDPVDKRQLLTPEEKSQDNLNSLSSNLLFPTPT